MVVVAEEERVNHGMTSLRKSDADIVNNNNNDVLLDAEPKDISASCSIVRTVV